MKQIEYEKKNECMGMRERKRENYKYFCNSICQECWVIGTDGERVSQGILCCQSNLMMIVFIFVSSFFVFFFFFTVQHLFLCSCFLGVFCTVI